MTAPDWEQQFPPASDDASPSGGFGARLRQARLSAGFASARALADAIEFSDSNIRLYEKDAQEPKLSVLLRLASACRVTVGWLAAGEGSPAPAGVVSARPRQARPLTKSELIETVGASGEKDVWFPPGGQVLKQRLGRAIEMAERGNPSLAQLRAEAPIGDSMAYMNALNVVAFYDQLTRAAATEDGS